MRIQIGLPGEIDGIPLNFFNETELELIGAFIYNTKLGQGITPHRDAAYTLLDKLTEFFGDAELEDRVNAINMKVEFYDNSHNLLISANVKDVEFDIRP